MESNCVIYSKPSGEPRVPVTIRIDWLPDGRIRPLMYWTPDGTCYRVTSNIECVPLAFLKDRGEGLRFRVKAEIIEVADANTELLHSCYETYLYFSDKRFSEKNIIDERYGHTGKEYITVTMDVFPDGEYELVYFCRHDARYMVERTCSIDPRGSFQAGGVGIRHMVEARLINADDDEDPDPQKSIKRRASLYRELNKWFIIVAKTA